MGKGNPRFIQPAVACVGSSGLLCLVGWFLAADPFSDPLCFFQFVPWGALPQPPPLWTWRVQVAGLWSSVWRFPVVSEVSRVLCCFLLSHSHHLPLSMLFLIKCLFEGGFHTTGLRVDSKWQDHRNSSKTCWVLHCQKIKRYTPKGSLAPLSKSLCLPVLGFVF